MKRQVVIIICMSALVLLVLGSAAHAAPGSLIQAAPVQQVDADVPVATVYCLNNSRLFGDLLCWGRPITTVRFGQPLTLIGDPGKSADAGREIKRVMDSIAELKQESNGRTVYSPCWTD